MGLDTLGQQGQGTWSTPHLRDVSQRTSMERLEKLSRKLPKHTIAIETGFPSPCIIVEPDHQRFIAIIALIPRPPA